MEVAGREIVVVGMARSGVAAARFLLARGARVTVNEAHPESSMTAAQRELLVEMRQAGVQVVTGGHPEDLFLQADLVVVSPGVPLGLEPLKRARDAGVEMIGEVELAARFLPPPPRGHLVGVTGTNGKTTTTTLIGEILAAGGLRVEVGGNIGRPLIELVDGSPVASGGERWIVAELSSFQLEAVDRLHVSVAVILNITPDHLDRYPSMEEYAEAKANILRNQNPGDTAILNADDPRVAAFAARTAARILLFRVDGELPQGLFLRGESLIYRDGQGQEQLLLQRDDIPLPGAHNLENVLAALAVGLVCGIDPASMRETVRSFQAVEHRLERVAEIEGVQFYNDSKATNVDAAIKSLASFTSGVTVILGGKDKGGDFAPLVPYVAAHCRHVILIGAAAEKIAQALEGNGPLYHSSTLEEAVALAFRLTEPGGIVLLAPACASFDMFENYEHRGRVFKQAVRGLQTRREGA
jgi:UDP-N-acetylmuramoylalanine--D-glutamate ligase